MNNNIKTAVLRYGNQNPEGFTFNIHTLGPQTTGYAVSLAATQNSFGPEGLVKVVKYVLTHRNANCIGGWYDNQTGLYYYDATVICNTLQEAVALGRQEGQIAIFHLDTCTEIRL